MVAHVRVGRARHDPGRNPGHRPVDTGRCCAVALRLAGHRSALLLAAIILWSGSLIKHARLTFATRAACGQPGYPCSGWRQPASGCRAGRRSRQRKIKPNW